MKLWLAGGVAPNLTERAAVRSYFASIPLVEINWMLRINFLNFLYGCNLHTLPAHPHAEVDGPKNVKKCFFMPFFDRAIMEFIHIHTKVW